MPEAPSTPTKLFVYGIFLDERHRSSYGMTDPSYATVYDFITVGHSIVQAVHIPQQEGVASDYSRFGRRPSLTGLLVTPDPGQWESLDRLEAGYDRILITTTSGERAYMYACHTEHFENHSTYESWEQRKAKQEALASER